jgi:biotin operon repressor
MRQHCYRSLVLNGQDIVVLLKLVGHGENWTVRSLEDNLGISRASVHRSLQRLSNAGLYDLDRRRANLSQAEEFLVHAVKYMFPPELNGETRGVPTAWAVPPLSDELAPPSDLPPVWPDPEGRQRGIALAPLHPTVPQLARRDQELGERLALIDAIRMGDARIRSLAAKLLRKRFLKASAPA